MNIGETLKKATLSRLEADLLLAHVLKKPRSYLYTWPDQTLSSDELDCFHVLEKKCESGFPLAYVLGKKEFFSREFIVTPDVLIPRPETELLIEVVLKNAPKEKNLDVIDLGTGSGAIAITLKKESARWEVIATDVSLEALIVAKKNAEQHRADIAFLESDWGEAVEDVFFDVVVSNPPYIAQDDPALEEAVKTHEPGLALLAENQGLAAFEKITVWAKRHLKQNGFIFLEHGYQQASAVRALLEKNGFSFIKTERDLAGHDRISYAQLL